MAIAMAVLAIGSQIHNVVTPILVAAPTTVQVVMLNVINYGKIYNVVI
jgi:hypothetical protein